MIAESAIEKAAGIYCKEHDIQFLKLNVVGQAGFPDRLLIGNGFMFFIEYKRKGKYPTPAQNRIHTRLRNQGHTVFVFNEIGQTEHALKMAAAGLVPHHTVDSKGITTIS